MHMPHKYDLMILPTAIFPGAHG